MEEELCELFIIAMAPSKEFKDRFVLVLEDESRQKRLSFLIGDGEALSIGIVIEKLKMKRPLTHDLLLSVISQMQGKVLKIVIYKVEDNVYYSNIYIRTKENDIIQVDCRTSDAIAVALRAQCPIYILRHIMDERSSMDDIYPSGHRRTSFSSYTLEELESLLKKVIEKEDYQSAIRIKETIERKKNG